MSDATHRQRMVAALDALSAAGNAMGLEGRLGARWGFIQLRARLDALESAIMRDPDVTVALDWSALSASTGDGEGVEP